MAIGGVAAGAYHVSPQWLIPAGQAATAPAPEQAVPVTVATLDARTAIIWDEFSGRLEAIDRVDVRARVAGAIQEVHFTEGDIVKAGELLVTIDPAPYAAEVRRLEAQVAGVEARLALTSSDLDRGRQLWGERVVTARDLDSRSNAFKEASASLEASKAALDVARLNLRWTEVRAAVGGRAGRREITTGNLVPVGTAGPVLTTIVSVDPIYSSFDADEGIVLRALASITEKSGGRGRIDRIPVEMTTSDGSVVQGRLQFIDNKVDARTGTIRVRAVFANGDGRLIPGQFARMRLGQAKPEPVLLVDERAVGTDQDKKFVLVVGDDSRATFRAVTLGRAVEGLRIVTSGLKAGERIVVNGLQRVRPGALVQAQTAAMGARPGPGGKPGQLAQR
ncbi:efflux RND transporter periplasmic adaptor subunit [Enterovirga rhinocerotis]|nr:efflux RND transporter periplasmic adaptor subunit [Enterovirga rhinocerotis]